MTAAAKLDQRLLDNESFWKDARVARPAYDRRALPVRGICFSAGRMAYGHTADILQDILNEDRSAGLMEGVETFSEQYCRDMAGHDFLMAHVIFGRADTDISVKIQAAIPSIL